MTILLKYTGIFWLANFSVAHCLTHHPRRAFLSSVGTTSSLVAHTISWSRIGTKPAVALTPVEAERQYDAYALSYDQLDGGPASSILGIEEARQGLMKFAQGAALEIGVGTGLNLMHYDASQLSSLTLVDISEGMLQQAQLRVQTLDNLKGIAVTPFKADATADLVHLFGEDAFDTVVDTFSLCVMGSEGARRCLDQVSRVVRPNGRVLLLENSRSSNPLLGLYQDATAETAAAGSGKGCAYNQDVAQLIRGTGRLEIVTERPFLAGLFRGFVCRKTTFA